MAIEKKEIETFDKLFWKLFKWFIAVVLFIMILPFAFTRINFLGFNFSTSGQIGDTIGGIMGPAIAIVACAFTFLAFWIQYKANQILQSDVDKRDKDVLIEKFEIKYYELLRLHQANIEQMDLAYRYKNRKVFQKLFAEYKFTFEKTIQYIQEKCNDKEFEFFGFDKDNEDIISRITYLIYFWGIGPNSTKIVSPQLKKLCNDAFIDALLNHLKELKDNFRNEFKSSSSETSSFRYDYTVKFTRNAKLEKYEYRFYYAPFDGHAQRVGHYYRHLFQTVKFVSEYDKEIVPEIKKYDYIKTLRAQLSSYEQLLLYYNSLTGLGKSWNEPKNNFIAKFRLIKNIPIPLTDFGLSPREMYKEEIAKLKKGEDFFEWDE